MKVSGKEWKAFYKDLAYWPHGLYHDDDEILVDGKNYLEYENSDNPYILENMPDTSVVDIKHGVVLKDNVNNVFGDEVSTLINYFKKWQKEQNVIYLVVEASKENLDDIKKAVCSAGGEIKA